MKRLNLFHLLVWIASLFFIVIISCEKDKGPLYIEPCDCDTTEYKEPNCPCDPDTTPPPCYCDTTEYRDINCPCDNDTTPYPTCPCDTSEYLDPYCNCDKDTIPHPGWCICDTTEWHERDCPCDTNSILLVSFKLDIQPIFEKYCVSCHYEGSGINVYETVDDTYAELKYGGYIRKGKPEQSKLIMIMRGDNPEMPPEPPYPAKGDIQLIKWWILQGAVKN